MRAHCLQHVPFEGPGHIETWLDTAGYILTYSKLFESVRFPRPESIDLLIVMGGPMSIHDEAEHAWLAPEKSFIAQVIAAGRPVLGICLGAQLIACSQGARVYPNEHKEIGWFPVVGTPSAEGPVFRFPPSLEVFHWHGETFELPPGAVRLAESQACRNQAFQLGPNVIGLQFHLETTPHSARQIVSNCRHELVAAPFIQTEEAILSAPPEAYQSIHRVMDDLLRFLQPG
jgi:GMP synthase-like glutamine amidotransferase